MKNISNILAGIDDNSSDRDLMIAVNELIDIINARRRSKDQAKRNDRRQICKEIKKLLAKGHHTTIMNVPEGFSFNGIDREGSYQVYIEKAFNEKVELDVTSMAMQKLNILEFLQNGLILNF